MDYEISRRIDGKYNVWAFFAPADMDPELAEILFKAGVLQRRWQCIDVLDEPDVDEDRWDYYDPFKIYRYEFRQKEYA